MAATSELKRAYVPTIHPDSRLCALDAVRSYCSLHIVPFRWYFHCGGGRVPPQITSNMPMQGRYRCYCACIKAPWCGSYTYTSDRTTFSGWIRPYLRCNDYIWCSNGFVQPSYHAQQRQIQPLNAAMVVRLHLSGPVHLYVASGQLYTRTTANIPAI